MLPTRWTCSLPTLFIYTIILFAYTTAFRHPSIKNKSLDSDHTYITVSIDKLLISNPPENCCTRQKLPNCEICVYTCKFHVYDAGNPRRVFIDHKFDCSIETTGKKIRIPLLSPLSAPKIDVELSIFTKSNDQLVSALAPLSVAHLEHEPDSRILKINIEDRYDINFNVSLTCVEGFVGPYCNISCSSPKIGEHHRCTPAGKYCESGYMGENCTIPVCTYGCSGHGTCIGPNVCGCDEGWQGSRCHECKQTDQCKTPYFDNRTHKCRCASGHGGKSGYFDGTLSDDLDRLDQKYGKTLEANNSTYLTLSVLIIVLLVICAFLLIVIVGLTLRNSDIKFPFCGSSKKMRKTQPTTTVMAPSLMGV